ncbi:hypothetical protein HBH51_196550 [Parastagonospora nodorum]|nr:hypothetical protein HBH51_196550 [Parastagonospora nodorum]KAH5729500.1 hypothetical protein HBI20_054160 [Parastagonospora nodorum]KAH6108787.1 hypothetical protein HBI69_165240 [Parastagonospora nodorum]
MLQNLEPQSSKTPASGDGPVYGVRLPSWAHAAVLSPGRPPIHGILASTGYHVPCSVESSPNVLPSDPRIKREMIAVVASCYPNAISITHRISSTTLGRSRHILK